MRLNGKISWLEKQQFFFESSNFSKLNKYIFTMVLATLLFAGSQAMADEILFDGSKFTFINSVLKPDPTNKDNKVALWKNSQKGKVITIKMADKDLSKFKALTFNMYVSENAPEDGCAIIFRSENKDSKGADYYYKKIKFNWKGWKTLVIPLKKLTVARKPLGIDKIERIYFANRGWGNKPNDNAVYYFDDMKLLSELPMLKGNSAESSPREDLIKGCKLLEKLHKQADGRKKVLNRPYVFIRSQMKYSGMLYKNHYNWHDRPLFANRLLWEESGARFKYSSFKKTFELYKSYGLDGFAAFFYANSKIYKPALKVLFDTAAAMKLDPKKFHIMPEIFPSLKYVNISDDDYIMGLIQRNPYCFRVDGKSVVSSYMIDQISPERLKTYIDKIRKKINAEVIFIPQINFHKFHYNSKRFSNHLIRDVWKKNGKRLPASFLLEMMNYLRSYLRVCGGLYVAVGVHNADYTEDWEFRNKVLIPLFKAVLAEPEFDGKKVFAMECEVGYTSYHSNQSVFRNGTKTLRGFFEEALKYQPDLMIGTEWDELNEDTGFEPLVAKPMSSQRIIKYYMNRFKGIKPTPNPGDDLSIPNLIISQRRQLMLGWKMDVELLNVPDTEQGEPYTVKLELLDIAGNVVFSSEPVEFNTAILKDKTFDLPSEKFKDIQALRSRLTINYRGKSKIYSDGLPFTVLRPTTCWDQTYFNTPLRNVLQPEKAAVNFSTDKKLPSGMTPYHVKVDLNSLEKINFVEVVQDSLEQFAYDPQNEFLQNNKDRKLFVFRWNYVNHPSRIGVKFTVDLDNAPSAYTFADFIPNKKVLVSSALNDSKKGWVKSQYTGHADMWARARRFSMKKVEIPNATLNVKGVRTNGKDKGKPFVWKIPLQEIENNIITSKVFEDGLMLSMEIQERPISHPLPLQAKHVTFERSLSTSRPNGILAVRAITENGKVYWSKPFGLIKPCKKTIPVFVYSDFKKKGIKLDVAKNRVPDIRYDFTTRWGNILHTSAGREFFGHIGGSVAIATGFVGQEHLGYTIPFRFYTPGYRGALFKGADTPAPKWGLEDGKTVMKFDGERGNFLVLPNTVIPQRAGFTLAFEIKPEEIKPYQVLFVHEGSSHGGINLSVRNGKFEMYFTRRNLHDPTLMEWQRISFKTNIPLYAGKWQKVVLTYDESKLTLTANGRSESFPMKGTGLALQISSFGGRGKRTGDGVIPFYKGLLRSLHIKHSVER